MMLHTFKIMTTTHWLLGPSPTTTFLSTHSRYSNALVARWNRCISALQMRLTRCKRSTNARRHHYKKSPWGGPLGVCTLCGFITADFATSTLTGTSCLVCLLFIHSSCNCWFSSNFWLSLLQVSLNEWRHPQNETKQPFCSKAAVK